MDINLNKWRDEASNQDYTTAHVSDTGDINDLAEESALNADDNGPLNNVTILKETYEFETQDDKQNKTSVDDVPTETVIQANDKQNINSEGGEDELRWSNWQRILNVCYSDYIHVCNTQ